MVKSADWLIVGAIAFLGGVVSNIVYPSRRGPLGFVSAAVVGFFGGSVVGWSGSEYGLSLGSLIIITAISSVVADRVFYSVFAWLNTRAQPNTVHYNTTVYGSQQQNIGQRGGEAGQRPVVNLEVETDTDRDVGDSEIGVSS